MINILGLILLIVVTIFVYRTAKDYEKNAVLWALAVFSIGFGIQIILPVILITVITVVMILSGTPQQKTIESLPTFTIMVVCIILSLVTGFLILRKVAQIPEDETFSPPPPPSEYN